MPDIWPEPAAVRCRCRLPLGTEGAARRSSAPGWRSSQRTGPSWWIEGGSETRSGSVHDGLVISRGPTRVPAVGVSVQQSYCFTCSGLQGLALHKAFMCSSSLPLSVAASKPPPASPAQPSLFNSTFLQILSQDYQRIE